MSEIKRGGTNFIGYEYKELAVTHLKAAFYLDCYESFGWHESEKIICAGTDKSVTLHLRRDRKISNKTELTRLQRNFEASMEELDALERSKAVGARAAALTAGICGTAFIAGATFAVTATPPVIWLCVLLAIPGFVLWAVPYFLYKYLYKKRAAFITPLIEQKRDEIYELCRKGCELL